MQQSIRFLTLTIIEICIINFGELEIVFFIEHSIVFAKISSVLFAFVFFRDCKIGTFNCTHISPHKTIRFISSLEPCGQKNARWKKRRKLWRPVSIHNVCLAFCAYRYMRIFYWTYSDLDIERYYLRLFSF